MGQIAVKAVWPVKVPSAGFGIPRGSVIIKALGQGGVSTFRVARVDLAGVPADHSLVPIQIPRRFCDTRAMVG